MHSEPTLADDEPALSDYVSIFRRRAGWIVLPVILATAFAAWTATGQPDRYSATSKVLVGNSAAQEALGSYSGDSYYRTRDLSNEISFATSDAVEAKVEEALGYQPDVTVSADADSDVLIFDATTDNSADAAAEANTWATTYVGEKITQAESSFDAAVARFQTRLEELRLDRQQTRAPLDDIEEQIAAAETALPGGDESSPALARLERSFDRLANDLEPELNLVDVEIASIADSITQLQLNGELAGIGAVRIIQVAAEPSEPLAPPVTRNIVLAGLLGLVAGAGLALLRENLDQVVSSADDVTSAVDLPILSVIPKAGRESRNLELALAFQYAPQGPIADGYQKLRSSLQFYANGGKLNSILVTSPNQSEGKTTTSSNLAWALAVVGQNVALADIDFRRPRVNEVYGIPLHPGLSNHILDGIPMVDLITRVGPADSNLVILSTGSIPASPGDFVAKREFLDTFRWIEDQSNVVILDAAPVLPVSDTLAIARHASITIVTAMAGKTRKDELSTAVQLLRQAGGNVAGVVLVGAKVHSRYGRYRSYGEPSPATDHVRPGLQGLNGSASSGGAHESPLKAAP